LLVDPSVYEDMKTVLGNIERNLVFKALVRMTIKEDGMQRPAKLARPGSGL
jgi:phospholipid/cholesterol/gamma-HCH transport system substrate-binding protein